MSEASVVVVRGVRSDDLGAITAIHGRAFPDSALTKVGAGALRRYYEWQCHPVHDAFNVVAVSDGRVVGFCFAGHFNGAMAGFLRRSAPYLIIAVAVRPWLLTGAHFRERARLGLRTLNRIARQAVKGTSTPRPRSGMPSPAAPPRFGILSIATDPAVQGRGVGKALMRAAEAEALRRGAKELSLTVDPGNEQAIRFYEGLGWRRVPANGVWQGKMLKP